MSNESVKIDKYVLKTEKSPKIIIFDNDLQKNIVSVNTLNNENNLLLAEMILAELNTGKYEVVEDDSGNTGDITNSDNGGLHTGDNSSNDGLTPIDESEGNNGAWSDGNDGTLEPTGDNDITGDTDNSANNEDLNNG